MDFKTQNAGATGLAGLTADALLVLVAANAVPEGLDAPLAAVLTDAVKDGDFAFKAGQTLYAHRLPGVKATRVLFAYAGDGSPKALRKGLGLALSYVKGSGAKQLSVALAGGPAWTAALAETLVCVVADATYLYRETKPSAPPASKLAAVSLVCPKSEIGSGQVALVRQY